MANNKTIHVLRDGDVWVVKKGNAYRASAIRNTQKEAYLVAREIALNQGLSITVHSPDGRIKKVIYPKDSSEDENCFITNACVKYYGLTDNCYQLQTLRKFRDGYLLRTSSDALLVDVYYLIAPKLIKLLNKDENKKAIYNTLFIKINSACKAIEKKENEKAKAIYENTVLFLLNYFKIL